MMGIAKPVLGLTICIARNRRGDRLRRKRKLKQGTMWVDAEGGLGRTGRGSNRERRGRGKRKGRGGSKSRRERKGNRRRRSERRNSSVG
jgi:hypothetical protein